MEVPIISISSSEDEKEGEATECSSLRSRDEEYRMLADLNGFENLKALIEGETMMKMNKGRRKRKKEGVVEMSEKEKRRDMELRIVADLNGFENLKALIEADALMKMNKRKRKRKQEGAVEMSEKEQRRNMELRMVADLTGFENLKGFIEGEALMKLNKGKKQGAVASREKEIRREGEFRMLADLTGFDNLKDLMEGEALMKRKQRKRKKKKKKKKNWDIQVDASQQILVDAAMVAETVKEVELSETDSLEILENPKPQPFAESSVILITSSDDDKQEEGPVANESRMIADQTVLGNLRALMQKEPLMKRRKQRRKKKKKKNIEFDAQQQLPVNVPMDGVQAFQEETAETVDILKTTTSDERQKLLVDATEVNMLVETAKPAETRSEENVGGTDSTKDIDLCSSSSKDDGLISNVISSVSAGEMISVPTVLNEENKTERRKEPHIILAENNVDVRKEEKQAEKHKDVEAEKKAEKYKDVEAEKQVEKYKDVQDEKQAEKHKVVEITTPVDVEKKEKLVEKHKDEKQADKHKGVEAEKQAEKHKVVEITTPVDVGKKEKLVEKHKDEKQADKQKGVEAEKQAEKHKVVEIMTPVDVGKKAKQVEKHIDAETMTPPEAGQVENIVLRNLLRKPRYFDSPYGSWVACHKCGGYHEAANCSLQKKKPCYICGSLQHKGKRCRKVQNPLISTERVHHEFDSNICLRCGNVGHDMFSCRSNYSPDDIKKIQCYMCKRFGHLCCVNIPDTGPREISCYNCGHCGHLGDDCEQPKGIRAHVVCYRCGEEGHFARRCNVNRKYGERNRRIRMSQGSSSAPPGLYKLQNNEENHNPRMDLHRYKESFAFQHHQERYNRVGAR